MSATDAETVVRALVERAWPGRKIERVEPLAGDASTRCYRRLQLGAASGEPATAIAMLMQDASIALSSEELGRLDPASLDEPPFVNVARFLSNLTDALPQIYAVSPDRRAILLEDVGDISLWAACEATPQRTESLFASALDWLAELQCRASDDGSGCYAFRQAFDEALFDWEFDHFLSYAVAPTQADPIERARAELHEVSRRLAAYPRVFCHRDFHAWNLHVQGNRLRVLDFQDALLGPALYDVASLLTDRSTPERVDEAMEERLLSGFLDASAQAHGLEPQQGRDAYRSCVLQRSLKVLGRFHYLAEAKGKRSYLRYITGTAATARRAAAGLEGLSAVRRLLDAHLEGVT